MSKFDKIQTGNYIPIEGSLHQKIFNFTTNRLMWNFCQGVCYLLAFFFLCPFDSILLVGIHPHILKTKNKMPMGHITNLVNSLKLEKNYNFSYTFIHPPPPKKILRSFDNKKNNIKNASKILSLVKTHARWIIATLGE